MTISAADRSAPEDAISPDSRPLAALDRGADDLPDLGWEQVDGTRIAVVAGDAGRFLLEAEDGAPDRQITVYGTEAGAALDARLADLGVPDESVLDRIDRRQETPVEGDVRETVVHQVRLATAHLWARMLELETRTRRSELERAEAAAALGLGAEELTERQKQTLSLILGGWSADEIAEALKISRGSVLRYKRQAIARHTAGLVGRGRAQGRSRRDISTGRESLTARERQVAALAAQGMSNAEIAEALFVSVKTAEWHLRHAYEKLDVGSRSELSAALVGG
jgi:DNA-binding CsgD family transcriptional regulator